MYGPVVGAFAGHSQPVILISGSEAVREALLNRNFDGRVDISNFAQIRFLVGDNPGNALCQYEPFCQRS